MFGLGYRIFLYMRNRCCPSNQQKGIQYRSSTPQKDKFRLGDPNDTVDEVLLSGTLLNNEATFEDSRSSTPLPTWDSLIQQQNAHQSRHHHPSVRSILQDSRVEDSSFSSVSSLQRRSNRIASSASFREESPSRLSTNTPSKSSRLGTPSRPSTPRRTCEGKCMDGSSCRNAVSKDSTFCWLHK